MKVLSKMRTLLLAVDVVNAGYVPSGTHCNRTVES